MLGIKSNSINQINVIAILFAGIFAFASAFIMIFNEYREFDKEIKTIEENYIKSRKALAVQQASKLYRLIDYRYDDLKDKPETTIYNLIAKEVEIVLDDSTYNGNYLFVFDSNNKGVYESKYVNLTRKIRETIFSKANKSDGFFNYITVKKR